MPNAVLTVGLKYTPPGGAADSATPSVSATSAYTPQVEGTVDIPDATMAAVVFSVPLGTVDSCSVLVLKNKTTQDLGIRINGALADQFQVPAGGIFALGGALPSAAPVTQLDVVTTALQTGVGQVDFYAFGPN